MSRELMKTVAIVGLLLSPRLWAGDSSPIPVRCPQKDLQKRIDSYSDTRFEASSVSECTSEVSYTVIVDLPYKRNRHYQNRIKKVAPDRMRRHEEKCQKSYCQCRLDDDLTSKQAANRMLELPAQEQLICRRWIEAAHRSKEWDRKFAKADKCADDAMKSKSTRRALTKEAQKAAVKLVYSRLRYSVRHLGGSRMERSRGIGDVHIVGSMSAKNRYGGTERITYKCTMRCSSKGDWTSEGCSEITD